MRHRIEHCRDLAERQSNTEFIQQLDHLRIVHGSNEVSHEIEHEINDMRGHRSWIRPEIYNHSHKYWGKVARSNYVFGWNKKKGGWIENHYFNGNQYAYDASRADCGLNNARTNKAIILNIIGSKLFHEKSYAEALTKFEEALGYMSDGYHCVLHANREDVFHHWGHWLFGQGQYEDAANKYWHAYNLNKGNPDHKVRALKAMGDHLSSCQEFNAALKKYDEALEAAIKDEIRIPVLKTKAKALGALGRKFFVQGNYATAAQKYEEAYDLSHDDIYKAEFHNALGSSLRAEGEYQESIAKLNEACLITKSNDSRAIYQNNIAITLNDWGTELYQQKLYDKAAEKYRGACDLSHNKNDLA